MITARLRYAVAMFARTTLLLLLPLLLIALTHCAAQHGIVGRWQGAGGQITEFTVDGRMITGDTESSYVLNSEASEVVVTSGDTAITYKFTLADDKLTLAVVEMGGRRIPEGDGMRLEFSRVR